jgi:uncharacterized protein DUF1902
MPSIIVVKATFDEEAQVWFTESADLPGLRIEADTLEHIQQKLPGAILDLLQACDDDDGQDGYDVPVELIAHASSRVRVRAGI